MSNVSSSPVSMVTSAVALACGVGLLLAPESYAQSFDFARLQQRIVPYTVILTIQVEYSFGTEVNEQEERLLGTIVREDGLIVFDGGFLSEANPFVPTGGMVFRSTPRRIRVTTLDKKEYMAEYVGVDSYTGLAFAQITGAGRRFSPVKFSPASRFPVGSWVATHALLPEFVDPPIAADIGMISSVITDPEVFPLIVGFSPLELGSVLFDERLNPVGLLGRLDDPSGRSSDPGRMESFDRMEIPLFGVVTAERLRPLIANPPRRGQAARSWLGITMQALTQDIADFLRLGSPGGIIVNEVVPGSPAAACGLGVGDIIYAVNGRRVEVDREEELSVFQREVANIGVGAPVELTVIRPDNDRLDTLTVLAVLAAAPLAAADAADFEYKPFELTVRDLVFSDYVGYNVEQQSLTGVVVTKLQLGGRADVSGLSPGDVIQRVNDQEVASVGDFAAAMTALEAGGPSEVVLLVWRFGQTLFVNVRAE
ncbi:MAG: PDZ domain-containing protein [Candidatus Zixiibacteriota bacterium]